MWQNNHELLNHKTHFQIGARFGIQSFYKGTEMILEKFQPIYYMSIQWSILVFSVLRVSRSVDIIRISKGPLVRLIELKPKLTRLYQKHQYTKNDLTSSVQTDLLLYSNAWFQHQKICALPLAMKLESDSNTTNKSYIFMNSWSE